METLLSKASHSDELVARINHTNLILDASWIDLLPYYTAWKKGLLPGALIRGLGDYLMRVVGSVPIGFHLTAESGRGESKLYYNDTGVVQI